MHSKRIVLTAMVALAGLHLFGFAWAQDEVDNTIEPQPLTKALAEFAEQTGMQLVYPSELTAGLDSKGASAEGSPDEILDELLASTGLEYEYVNDRTIAIAAETSIDMSAVERRASDKGGDSHSKNLNPAPVLMAQNTSNQTQTTVKRSSEGGTSIVTGRVTDARTGANLKGALVTIVETGQSTSTNDLGEFHLTNVPTGSVTLTVSFLGYAGQSAVVGVRSDGGSQNFALRGGNEIEEIVVFGQRSARAQALNLERTAENSTTVLSADLLGRFEGATIAEALRRAPGVTFQEDDLTGDGTNVIIRGLAPDLNQIRLDGQRLAEGTGRGRSPSIGNLLTESIDTVTISKTLLPSQDSNGSGGLVEITTKGPLDRAARFAAVSAQSSFDDSFTDSQQFSGIVSGIFGTRSNIGLSTTVQYRETEAKTVSYRNSFGFGGFGQYLPLDDDGNPIGSPGSIDPRRLFPFEDGVDEVYPFDAFNSLRDAQTETLAGTVTAQWRPFGDTTWRASYTRSERDVASSSRDARIFEFAGYVELPIEELGGERRAAYVAEDFFGSSFPGHFINVGVDLGQTVRSEETDVLSLQGETRMNNWEFNYRLSRSTGETTSEIVRFGYDGIGDIGANTFSVPYSILSDTALNNTVDGRVVSIFAPASGSSYQPPLFNDAGFLLFNDPNTYGFQASDTVDLSSREGENERQSAFANARYDFDNASLKYIEFGAEFESARFDSFQPEGRRYFAIRALGLDDLGLDQLTEDNLSEIGVGSGFRLPSDNAINRFIANLSTLSTGPEALFTQNIIDNSSNDAGTFTDEDELAFYLQGRIDIGDFEVIGGVRYSQVDVNARILTTPSVVDVNGRPDFAFQDDFRQLVNDKASLSSWLPRLLVNYRPTEDIVVRAGFYRAVSRPTIGNLADRSEVTLNQAPIYGPDRNQPRLQVRRGNPDLNPSTTDSFDLSFEYYDKNVGVLGLSVFYKDISDFVEFNSDAVTDSLDGVQLPDDDRFEDLDGYFIEVIRPVNNDESASIWGVELNIEKQFSSLPGAWGGLGVYANYTYTDSEKFFTFDNVFDESSGEFVDIEVSGVPFDQSPRESGTVALTYNKNGFDGSVAYTAQSERLQSFEANGLSEYNDSDDSLDARLEYWFDGDNWRIFAEWSDILKGKEDPDVLSFVGDADRSVKYYTGSNYFGGRTFVLGVTANF